MVDRTSSTGRGFKTQGDGEAEQAVRGCSSLEVVMAHVSVSSIPAHAFDTAVGEILTRVVVFARVLPRTMETS